MYDEYIANARLSFTCKTRLEKAGGCSTEGNRDDIVGIAGGKFIDDIPTLALIEEADIAPSLLGNGMLAFYPIVMKMSISCPGFLDREQLPSFQLHAFLYSFHKRLET